MKYRPDGQKGGDMFYYHCENFPKMSGKFKPEAFRERAQANNIKLIEVILFRYMRKPLQFSHWMLNDHVNCWSYYLQNYNEIENLFPEHPQKYKLAKNSDGEFVVRQQTMTIATVVEKMIQSGLLKPMSDENMNKLDYSFEQYTEQEYNHSRPIVIPKKNFAEVTFKPEIYGQYYFGFKPELSEVRDLIDQLQDIVNTLVSGIDVRCYSKFSKLMQHIMFEYGCFEGVLESSGYENKMVRDSIKFPKPQTKIKHAKQKLYYLDIIGAYSSCIDGIPLTLDVSGERNYRINDLIQKLFDIRKKLKDSGSKLAYTIKFMMNSCFGFSMKKSKHITTKYSTNVDSRVDEMFDFVAKYTYKDNGTISDGANSVSTNTVDADEVGKEGFVTTLNTFHPHFNHVQHAKVILDNYWINVKEIMDFVDVLYWNIDAFLVNEEDYNKLLDIGMIGEDLGQLKVECVFDEVVFKSARCWMGILDNGETYCRPRNLIEKYSFSEFKSSVI
jgi:hypothetical protein